jgi:hypothetical protein
VEEPYQDTVRRRWKAKSENTHWLDASYYSDVAANMKGIRLAGPIVSKPTQSIPGVVVTVGGNRPRMSLAQLTSAASGQ